jgi:hypothetical protein
VSTWCDRCALQFPALALLGSEFLHADWPEEYDAVDDAVRAFATQRPRLADRLPIEVAELFALMLCDEQLEDMLIEHLGIAYRPPAGESYGSWLQDAARRVDDLIPRP